MKSGYHIIDEIEPVTDQSYALHPKVAFWGSMLLPMIWQLAVSALNSFLLGHPRRKHHAALCVAAMMVTWSVVFVALAYMPVVTWKYCALIITAVRLWIAYYLSEEQSWAAEMFEQAGGKVASLRATIAILRLLAFLVIRRVNGLFVRPVR